MMTCTRVYSMAQIKELLKGYWFPTSISLMLKRERIDTKEVNGKIMWNADQVDELVREIKR